MKKLITLVAAMIGFGAFAVEPEITGTGFETLAYTNGYALAVDRDDDGVDYALEGYKGRVWEASKDLGEDAMVKAYDQDSGSYTPSATYGTRHQAIGNNYLGLDIGDARLDRYMVNCKNNNEEQPQEISATGFYIDTLVKFTAAEEPSWSAMQEDTDKLSITYIEHDADPTADPVDAGYTNFVVRAGFINEDGSGECTITKTEYKLSVPENFDKSAWHRLTVRAIKDIGYEKAPVAFVVYVDEQVLEYSSETKISTDNVTFGPMGTRFYSDKVHALLPSLINDAVSGKNISKLGFSGTGSIDNIAFVQNVIPEFVTEEIPATLKWGAGFASITITPAGTGATPIVVKDLTVGELAFELPLGVNAFTVAATYETGYEALPWTMNGVEIEGATFANVTPGAVCELKAMKPVFNVIIGSTETKFESLEDALDMIADADEDSTLKLVADYEGDVSIRKTYGKEGVIILDLAGKTITGTDDLTLINESADLIITNSTSEIGSIVAVDGDEDSSAIRLAGGTTEIYAGKVCGGIELDGFDAFEDTLTVFGGTFYDAAATGEEDFYLVSALDPSVEGKVVGPDEDGYITVGVAPEVKPFQVIIGAADPVGYDTFELALAAANEAEAAKIVLGDDVTTESYNVVAKSMTIDLNGHKIACGPSNNRGVFVVNNGATLTVDDTSELKGGVIDGSANTYAAVALTNKDAYDDTKTAGLVVNAGKLKGFYYGICGNGNRHNTSIVINGGTIEGVNTNPDPDEGSLGIYHPQNGTLTVNDGTISGFFAGIEMRAGTLDINGGTISSTITPTQIEANGNGSTVMGAAVGISQHNTGIAIAVTIDGATLNGNGASAVAVVNPQNKEYTNVEVTLGEATYNGALYLGENADVATITNVGSGLLAPEGYKWDDEGKLVAKEYVAIVIAGDPAVETKFESFADAFAAANAAATPATLKLLAEIVTPSYNVVAKDMTLDLNGQKISCGPSNVRGVFVVNNGATLTVDDTSALKDGVIDGSANTYAAVALTNKDAKDNTKTAGVVVKAGTLQGLYYGIVGNGSVGRENTSIVIDGGVVKGTAENNCAGIYNPQGNSKVVINGGVVEGAVGIYAKAGTITVNGGEVKAVGVFVETPTFNGDGFEPCGDAIVLDSAAGYAGNVSLTLGDDATLTSANGFAVREAVTKGANTTLAIADNGATLTAPKGGLAVSDEFAEKLASGGATITGYTIAIDGVCGNDSLLAAIGKVTDGGTITLLANVTDAIGIAINTKKTFTVDFNGFTYTVNKPGAGSAGTTKAAFQLLKGQTVTFKNGKIQAAADNLVKAAAPNMNIYRFIQNYANLTLENMTFDATNLYIDPEHAADYFPSAVEVCYGTVALTGSTAINDKTGLVSLTVDTYKTAAYKEGADVTINTTGTIASVFCYSEGTYTMEGNTSLTLEAGTIGALTVDGNDEVDVTKTGATVTAPEGYEWDETTGELKKVEEPTGLTLMIAGQPYDAATNPYVIRDVVDFGILQADVALNEASVYGSCRIVMTNDIDMTGVDWTGVGVRKGVAFKGEFDGQGHKVKNLTLAYGMTYNGLFGHTSGATVKNLTVEFDGFAAGEGGECGGAIIGRATEGLTLENVTAEGALSGNHKVAGLVVQVNGGATFTDCTNKCAVTSTTTAAGFLAIGDRNNKPTGATSADIAFVRCSNEAAIAGGSESAAAFFAYYQGMDNVTLDSCVNVAAVTGPAGNTAVIIGSNHDDQNQYVVENENTFTTAASDTLVNAANLKVLGFNLYADDTLRTYFADDAVVAGGTYTLAANATPAITLAEDESISFIVGGFTLTEDGIAKADGLEIEVTEAEGVKTFTAVAPKNFEVIIAGEAKQFGTFADAVAAAAAASVANPTVKLIDDATVDPIVITDAVTVDLNGKILTGNKDVLFYVKAAGKEVVFTNGTLVAGDVIEDVKTNLDPAVTGNYRVEKENGVIVVSAGTVDLNADLTILAKVTHGVFADHAGTVVNVNGATLTQTKNDRTSHFTSVLCNRDATVVINDGAFSSEGTATSEIYLVNNRGTSNGIITINGGTFGEGFIRADNSSEWTAGVSTINVKGGTFNGTTLAVTDHSTTVYRPDFNVTGGTFNDCVFSWNAGGGTLEKANEAFTFTGGIYNTTKPADDYIGEGYVAKATGDAQWEIVEKGLTLMIADQEYNAETNPYVIACAADFAILQKDVAKDADSVYGSCRIVMTNDVDMSGIAWTGVGVRKGVAFKGEFDGQGHKVKNLTLAYGMTYNGLFGHTSGATVKNLTVEFDGFAAGEGGECGGAIIGRATEGLTLENVTAEGALSGNHKVAGLVVQVNGGATFTDCTNKCAVTSTTTAAGFLAIGDRNNKPTGATSADIAFVRCSNEAAIAGGSESAAAFFAYYQGMDNVTLDSCVNVAAVTGPAGNTAVIIGSNHDDQNQYVVENENTFTTAASDTLVNAANLKVLGFTYAIVDAGEPAMATFVADSALVAGGTYTLYADATPAITLAADESITFDKNGFTLTATGIVAGEGAELNDPAEEGTRVTYSAKAASTGPTIDEGEGEGTQVMIADDKTITNVNSTVALALPEGWEISKDGEIFTIVDGKQEVWGKFPVYYAAVLGGYGKVAISLSEAANLIVQDATDVEAMDDGETEIFAVSEEEVGLAVKNTYKGLYYGLATCATVDGDYADPATVVQVEEDGQLIRLEAAKGGDACFYKMWVSDIAPEAAE